MYSISELLIYHVLYGIQGFSSDSQSKDLRVCVRAIKSVLTFSVFALIKYYISRSRARGVCVFNSCACSYSHGAVGN